jgi:hypothetical protein
MLDSHSRILPRRNPHWYLLTRLVPARGLYLSHFRRVPLPPQGPKRNVHNVHTPGFGLRRIGARSGRIPYVFGGVQCLQVLESGSSPTSGTA